MWVFKYNSTYSTLCAGSPVGGQGFTRLFLAFWMTSYQMKISDVSVSGTHCPKKGFDHQPIQRLKKGRSAFVKFPLVLS